jgi:hypothetical protein
VSEDIDNIDKDGHCYIALKLENRNSYLLRTNSKNLKILQKMFSAFSKEKNYLFLQMKNNENGIGNTETISNENTGNDGTTSSGEVRTNQDNLSKRVISVIEASEQAPERKMKGVIWNGNTIANKGSTTSRGRGMFSVDGLIAFQTSSHCSPDGNDSSYGCDPTISKYLLQEEIELCEFDNTLVNQYGSGSVDRHKIVELNNLFCHSSCGNKVEDFLFAICDDAEPRLSNGVAKATRIEEVRDNPGKFLHVYQVGSSAYRSAKDCSSFEESVKKINDLNTEMQDNIQELEKTAAKKRENENVSFTKEGIEAAILNAQISYGEDTRWGDSLKEGKISDMAALRECIADLNKGEAIAMMYKSPCYSKPDNTQIYGDKDVRTLSIGTADPFDRAVRGESLLAYKIVKKIPYKGRIYCGSFEAGGVVDVFQTKDGSITHETNRYESWNNSQHWEEQVRDYNLPRFEIETGEEGLMSKYNQEGAARKSERCSKFEKFSTKIVERFGEDALTAAKKHKGTLLKDMENLLRLEEASPDMTIKILNASRGATLSNLVSLVNFNPLTEKIKNITKKANAWVYIESVLPFVKLDNGDFSEAIAALTIYGEGGFESDGDSPCYSTK